MKRCFRYWLVMLLVLGAWLPVACRTSDDAGSDRTPPVDLNYLINSNPAEVDDSDLPITPVDQINLTGVSPDVDIDKYRLIVDGLVTSPLSLTYEDILDYPAYTEVVLLICPGFFVDNAEWSGVPLSVLLAEAGVKLGADEVVIHAMNRYEAVLPLEAAQREGVFLAHTVNGEVLPEEHGYPVRLVVKGNFGGDWVKWVGRLEVK